jgi:hypothetical protein
MKDITALVLKLQEPGLNIFDQHEHRKTIAEQGRDAVRALLPILPHDPPLIEGLLLLTLKNISSVSDRERAREDLEYRLGPAHDSATRQVCGRLLVGQFPDATHVGQRLLDFAADGVRETRDLRLSAVKAAAELKPASTLGHRFVALLTDADTGIVLAALSALSRYVGILSSEDIVRELERLIGPSSKLAVEVRCSAINLLGQFGEIDILERVMLLPLRHDKEYQAVQAMVLHLLRKPRSAVRLSPKNFEHLICRLLEKMGYEDVEVQSKGSWDDGVDVTAWLREQRLMGLERIKVLGQCKRYRQSSLLGPDVVEKMVESLKLKQGGRGVIITTSGFQPAAIERSRSYKQIEMITGADLQVLLDKHFDTGLYRVGE